MVKNPTLKNDENRKAVKDLAEAFSVQAKYSNRLWLATIVAATLVVFPSTNGSNVELAFSLGEVPRPAYDAIGFLILVVVTLAYFQAYAQTHNAARFLHREIAELKDADARRFYDLLVVASFARVAPLVDTLLNLVERLKPPYKNKIGAIYYVVLKFVANIVILGIPSAAVGFAYRAIYSCKPGLCINLPGVISVATVAIALVSLSLIIICIAEATQVIRTAALYWQGKLTRPAGRKSEA